MKKIVIRVFLILVMAALVVVTGLFIMYNFVVDKTLNEQNIAEMPEEYEYEADQKGRLEVVSYETNIGGFDVTKYATVYLPFGYDSGLAKYDVVYLMHGRGGDYKTWLGTPRKSRPFKNVLDNMIQNDEIKPLIVVAPGLSYEYGEDDDIMDGTATEIVDQLIPLIDAKYATYGDRDHRCMSGFSMGGSLTWHMVKDHMDCFRYYIPMSMALYYDSNGYSERKSILSAASMIYNVRHSGYTAKDFKIYAATGADDHKAMAAFMQVEDLIVEDDCFVYADDEFKNGNIMFKIWPFRWHRYTQSFPYMYNGLLYFFYK